MKERVFKFANLIWQSAKSPLGLTLIGGATGSVVTHVLGNSHRERKLQNTKENLDQERNKNKALYEQIEEHKDRTHVLLFSLREADKYGNRTRTDLETTQRHQAFIQHAFDNSFCFYRHKIPRHSNEQSLNVSAEMSPTITKTL